MKRSLVILALFLASVVTAPTLAQGNFHDYGKATAGVIVYGGVACALTHALLNDGLALCSPRQVQYGRPFVAEQHAHLLPQQMQHRYLGRIYVPAGQQPGMGSYAPPAPPPATGVTYEQLPPGPNVLIGVKHNCRADQKPWVPPTCPTEFCPGKCVPK